MMTGVLLGIEEVICHLVSVEYAWRLAFQSVIGLMVGANIEAL